ncbi:MAG: FHIPEP family type III secretion protein, partial [Rhodospirillales bacterium]|nr:FHIPEP family type III secretion protein [Rhodospirillales bacterium]
ITFINVVGGIIIGVLQNDMALAAAGDTYTRLTVGDGLVTQIPALIVSTAAGMLVTKAGVTGATEDALASQLTRQPKALGLTAFLLGALALVPGTPMVPFVMLAAATSFGAWYVSRNMNRRKEEERVKAEAMAEASATPLSEEPVSAALKIDTIRLELGYGLLSLVNSPVRGQRVTDQIKALRRQVAGDMGFVIPSVRIQDNVQLSANEYIIRIKEIDAGHGELRPSMLLVMDPRGEEITLTGEKTTEPTFGLPAVWIEEPTREEALFRGYTVVDPSTVITTHLTEVIKDNMSELLSYVETQKLLDELDKDHQKLIMDMVPGQISISGIQRVLQNLLNERVSVRDLPTILEAISEACAHTRSALMISEHVRSRLSRQICDTFADENGTLLLVTLSPDWEQGFAESLTGSGEEQQIAMAPSKIQEFITGVRQTFERHAMQGESPALLTSPTIRPYVRSIIERFRPTTPVISQNEIHPKARIKTVGQI